MASSRAPRLFIPASFDAGAALSLDKDQTNYLANVLRLGPGDSIFVFNGHQGEWSGRIDAVSRKQLFILLEQQTRPPAAGSDLHYWFAPLKHARLDYMAQKATEMGVACLAPVLTRRTQVSRVNIERLRANAIEAAEQCGLLTVPVVKHEVSLEAALQALESERWLIFCDEDAEVTNPLEALRAAMIPKHAPLTVLIGPEGGFDPQERTLIMRHEHAIRLSLGPRILRADTAAVAALALVQAALGDWS